MQRCNTATEKRRIHIIIFWEARRPMVLQFLKEREEEKKSPQPT
jgi:hypothetical protein